LNFFYTNASGSTYLDDIKVFGEETIGTPPVVTFDINDTNVDISQPLTATSDKELYRALDGTAITNATEFFVLKEGSSTGDDVPFSATIDGARKKFTITPSTNLKPSTNFYIALKNRVVADADGTRALLVEKTFKTGVDTVSLLGWIETAELELARAVEGERPNDYIVGSKKILQEAIDAALAVMRNPESNQADIDAQAGLIEAATNTFFLSKVPDTDFDNLKAAIAAAKEAKKEEGYEDKYTPESREELDAKLAAAETISGNAQSTQAEADAAEAALLQAIEDLVEIDISICGTNADSVLLFPNPADDVIYIAGVEAAQVTVYSATGATLFVIDNYNSSKAINISALAAGTYFVTVEGKAFSFTKK